MVLLMMSAQDSNDDPFGVLLGVMILAFCRFMMSVLGVGGEDVRFFALITTVSPELLL